jgi:hypothetical protein
MQLLEMSRRLAARNCGPRSVIVTLLIVLIFHNLMVQDYKGDILNQLKGQLSEEESFAPKDAKMMELQNEMQRLSADIKQVRLVLNETLVSMGKNPLGN